MDFSQPQNNQSICGTTEERDEDGADGPRRQWRRCEGGDGDEDWRARGGHGERDAEITDECRDVEDERLLREG